MKYAMIAMPKYESYKDSGVEWIGDIPTDWKSKKFKYLADVNKGKLPEKIVSENEFDLPPYLSMDYLRGGEANQFVDDKNAVVVNDDELLLLWDGSNSGEFIKSRKGVVSSTLAAVYFYSLNKKFAWYVCQIIERVLRGTTVGMGIPHVSGEELKNSVLTIPSEKEQEAIAKFLDEKTGQIDQAIGIKEKQIALLKERKQIIIQNAVTKGLNPSAPMKDSGVDWIGDIPAHWEIEPGMNVLREKKDSNKGMKESRVLSLSYGAIIIKPEEKLIGLVPESFETYQIAVPGDIIIRCTDLQNDQTSLRTGLVKDKGIITSAYLNLNVKEPHFPEFVHYFLHFLDITKVLYKFGSGLRQNLSWVDFKRMPMVNVPYDEQKEIVKYIEDKSAEIKSATDLLIQQIEKLKEYKASLINSAVTGKIKVV